MTDARRPVAGDLPGILDAIMGGMSLRKACEARGIHPGHAQAMFRDDDRLWAQYMRARALQGDDQGHRVGEIAELVIAKKIEPDVGRAAMQGLMWSSSRMNRKLWGDRLAHEHSGEGGGPIQTVDLSNLSEEQLANLEGILQAASAAKPAEPTD